VIPLVFGPAYYYQDDEYVAIALKTCHYQTVFNVAILKTLKEIRSGHAILIEKNWRSLKIKKILELTERKACSF